MEQIAKQRGVKWTHVPFKGAAETNAALLGGHVDAVADSTGWGALVELRRLPPARHLGRDAHQELAAACRP